MSIITAACSSSAGLSSSGYRRAQVSRFSASSYFHYYFSFSSLLSFCSCSVEFICAHHHVWILLAQCSGATPVPVSLVEALFNRTTAAAVCIRSGLGHSSNCKQVRISAVAQLYGSGVYVIISFSLRTLLCAKVYNGRQGNRWKMH